MKTKLLLALISLLLFASCSKNNESKPKEPPRIQLTIGMLVGNKIYLTIDAEEADREDVWIDLNNNGEREAGEDVLTFAEYKGYTTGASTITVHGKVTGFSCKSNEVNSLDVSKNTFLTSLSCAENNLTQLDISKNRALKELSIYRNNISDAKNMQHIVDNLPLRKKEDKGVFQVIDKTSDKERNVITKDQLEQVDKKNWQIRN